MVAGCTAAESDDRAANDGAAITGDAQAADPTTPRERLTIGLMPAVDTAPFYVAADAGYFSDIGLDVDFQLFTSAQDRQAALQSGRLDGAMTDLVAVAVNVAAGFDLRAALLTDGVFPVLVRPGTPAGGRVSIGLMEVSVSNFLADQWLRETHELDKVFITAIPARLEALAAGQIDMGIFPEPVASVAAARGLEKRLFEPVDGFSPDVIAFTGEALSSRERAIRLLVEGYNRAIADIIRDPSQARAAIMTHIPNISPEVRDDITLPTYHLARLPTDAYLERIIAWTASVVGSPLEVAAADLVDRRFVD